MASKLFSGQTCVCHDKTRLLSQQNDACRNKTIVSIKLLSRLAYFCRYKIMFVAANICRDKRFVATNIISPRQKFVSTSILLSQQKTCLVATNTCLSRQKRKSFLSRQKLYLWQLPPQEYLLNYTAETARVSSAPIVSVLSNVPLCHPA